MSGSASVRCSKCKHFITEIRYNCAECDDYDLCKSCNNSQDLRAALDKLMAMAGETKRSEDQHLKTHHMIPIQVSSTVILPASRNPNHQTQMAGQVNTFVNINFNHQYPNVRRQ